MEYIISIIFKINVVFIILAPLFFFLTIIVYIITRFHYFNKYLYHKNNYIYKIFKNNIICDYIKELSSYSTAYRREHAEFREKEKIINNEREKARYNNDPEYRERVKQRALARHHKLKETKDNACISVN